MLEMRNSPLTASNDVYIICRVFNLLSSDINMRFYVSPGREGSLYMDGSSSLREEAPAQNLGFFGLQVKPILKFTSKGFEVRPVK